MEDFFDELGRGFFRAIGYILGEIFFRFICYWVGWPICKLLSFGRYPCRVESPYRDSYSDEGHGFWCSAVGCLVLLSVCIYLLSKS